MDDLEAAWELTAGAPVVVERRKTFYGADEFGVREPAGNVVMFSKQGT